MGARQVGAYSSTVLGAAGRRRGRAGDTAADCEGTAMRRAGVAAGLLATAAATAAALSVDDVAERNLRHRAHIHMATLQYLPTDSSDTAPWLRVVLQYLDTRARDHAVSDDEVRSGQAGNPKPWGRSGGPAGLQLACLDAYSGPDGRPQLPPSRVLFPP